MPRNSARLNSYSKDLRKNMTKEERHLWYDFLKQLDVNVHRQKVIGNYILDFYVAAAKLGIELDGSQHYEDEAVEYDKERDNYFENKGILVLRYPNNEVNSRFSDVCEDILRNIEERVNPHQSASQTACPRRTGIETLCDSINPRGRSLL